MTETAASHRTQTVARVSDFDFEEEAEYHSSESCCSDCKTE